MHRERDPLLELWKHGHDRTLERIQRVAIGDEGKAALDAIGVELRSLAASITTVLDPAFARVSLAFDAQRLLEDCRVNLAFQQRALDALAGALRSPRLRKLRALQLSDLVGMQAESYGARLLPILRSQLPRPLYRAVSAAFATRHAPQTERSTRRSAQRIAS